MHIIRKSFLLTALLFITSVSFLRAEGGHSEAKAEKFEPGEMIMHHIADEHEWHFATIGQTHLSLPLPCIVVQDGKLKVFMSSKFKDADHKEVAYDGLVLEHGKIHAENGGHVLDLSITKNVASLILSFVLLITLFLSIAKRYKDNPNAAPKGFWQSAMEPIILFIRDDVAKNYIGEKYHTKFLPYLLTLFFFIWINNLLGLMPGGANLTGNIAVTLVLAILTFIIVNVNGKSTYWTHIFAMPGVPKWMLIILTPVEIVGVFMRPFSLMIRLFANITAGHIILLSLLSMIFIFKTIAVSPVVALFTVFMNLIELLVAALQAYIFTVLTASYIGAAVEEDHHH